MNVDSNLSGLQEFYRHVESLQFRSIYYVVGVENYFKEQIIRTAQSKLINSASRDFNLDIFFCPENSDSQILNACYAMPMLSDHRLVIVHDFDLLSISDPDAFLKYFKQPSPSTTVIITATKEDKRKKVISALRDAAQIILAEPLKSEVALLNWIRKKASSAGYQFNEDALELFLQFIGDNLFDLDQNLTKISIYKGDDKVITVTDVENMTGVSRELSVFEMINQLLKRRQEKTIKILYALLEQGQEALAIIGALYYRFQKQWQFLQHLHEKSNEMQMLQKSGIRKFTINGFKSAAAKYNRVQIEKSLQSLHKADVMLKSTSEDPKNVLVFTIQEILNH